MYVWDNREKNFKPCPLGWVVNSNPDIDFTGTVILIDGSGEAVFRQGELISYSKSIEELLPEIIIALSRKESSGTGWKIKGRIFNESVNLRSKAPPLRPH